MFHHFPTILQHFSLYFHHVSCIVLHLFTMFYTIFPYVSTMFTPFSSTCSSFFADVSRPGRLSHLYGLVLLPFQRTAGGRLQGGRAARKTIPKWIDEPGGSPILGDLNWYFIHTYAYLSIYLSIYLSVCDLHVVAFPVTSWDVHQSVGLKGVDGVTQVSQEQWEENNVTFRILQWRNFSNFT